MKNAKKGPVDFPSRMLSLGAEFKQKAGDRWSMVGPQPGPMPLAADAETPLAERQDTPYAMGARRSWVPALGESVWELPKALAARSYYAYVCRESGGQQIGYVRVPDYNYNEDAVNVFGEEIVARFESTTEAMVLDQVDNWGGSMFQMYALLSMLTDRALALPKHQIMIDEDYAAIAADVVANAEAGEAVPPDERPTPERVAYSRFVLSERAAGRGTGLKPSNPVYLEGVAEILPGKNHYTKKIIVLINELCFSAGEFLAAILQDNKRALLFGVRTAGAGGCAKRICIPNDLGVGDISMTWTIAQRTNGQPIEGVGVHPDVSYSVTAEDIRSGYANYRQALLATINA